MIVVRNHAGEVAATRAGDRLTIHVRRADSEKWHGLTSRSAGDGRRALLTALGLRACQKLELS